MGTSDIMWTVDVGGDLDSGHAIAISRPRGTRGAGHYIFAIAITKYDNK